MSSDVGQPFASLSMTVPPALVRSILLAGLWLGAWVGHALALTVTAGPQVEPAGTSAIISWSTDVEAGTRVQYGVSKEALTQRVSGGVGREHRVELTGLQGGTQYHFSIGSARSVLGHGSFQTTGPQQQQPAAPATPVASTTADKASSTPDTDKSSLGASVRRFFTRLVSPGGGDSTSASTSNSTEQAKPKPKPVQTASAPPTTQTWRQLDTLADHYLRHGRDFQSVSQDQYAAQAWLFLQRARQSGLPMKLDDADDTLRVWDPKNRTFAAYDSRGRTRTFFKPSRPDYWTRQPGRPVTSAELSFQ